MRTLDIDAAAKRLGTTASGVRQLIDARQVAVVWAPHGARIPEGEVARLEREAGAKAKAAADGQAAALENLPRAIEEERNWLRRFGRNSSHRLEQLKDELERRRTAALPSRPVASLTPDEVDVELRRLGHTWVGRAKMVDEQITELQPWCDMMIARGAIPEDIPTECRKLLALMDERDAIERELSKLK